MNEKIASGKCGHVSSNICVDLTDVLAAVDVHHDKVLWTPYNLRKTAMFDKIYNSGVKYMEDDYLDMQTGAFDPAQTYYNAESHEVSLPNDVNSTLSKFA